MSIVLSEDDLQDILKDNNNVVKTIDEKINELGATEKKTISMETVRKCNILLEVCIGSTYLPLEDILKLEAGSVVQLEKIAGEPIDLKLNGQLIARGEVVVINDHFGIRIEEII